jgi:hypothetical protein
MPSRQPGQIGIEIRREAQIKRHVAPPR